jgi:hypothetical protein
LASGETAWSVGYSTILGARNQALIEFFSLLLSFKFLPRSLSFVAGVKWSKPQSSTSFFPNQFKLDAVTIEYAFVLMAFISGSGFFAQQRIQRRAEEESCSLCCCAFHASSSSGGPFWI